MVKRFTQRIGAICTGAVLTFGSICTNFGAAPITASAADANYARLLQYSLYFYDANMCGSDVKSKTGMNWRGNCHTDDAVPGGYHDAGDHAMFGLPQGYTATALELSYLEFKDAYEATGQADHIKMILDRFATFFKNSTKLSGDNVSNFLYQKGNGKVDHGYWGPPESQSSRSNEMYWTSSGASDIAANYASALALHAKNFGSSEDLNYAKALYNFSTRYNQCAKDGPSGFYDSEKCKDEQTMAAGCLALATGDSNYKNALSSGVKEIGVWWAYGWNDANLGAAVMNGIVNKDWSAANSYIGGKCNGSGYLFMDKWGSARLNCSMLFMALVATREGAGNYTDWAIGQMNYILGSNPANTCFVTGFASNSAKNAHHRGASGYTSYSQFNGNNWDPNGDHSQPFAQYGGNSKPLIGALVGGPCDAGGSYHDNMNDYVCNEVAIDYNAGLVGAAAGLYHFKKSGTTDTSINGVTKIYSGGGSSSETEPSDTTTTPHSSDPYVDPSGETTREAVVTGSGRKFDINVAGASKVTVTFKTNSNDWEATGCFGYMGSKWEQDDWKANAQSGTVKVEYDIPSGVNSLQFQIFWPESATFESAILTIPGGGGSSISTETTTTSSSKDNPHNNYKRGDVDVSGSVDILDAVLLARVAAEDTKCGVTDEGKGNADVNSDGSVKTDDLTKLLKYLANILTEAQFNA